MARRYDRRDFMGLSGAGVAGLFAPPWTAALAAVEPGPRSRRHSTPRSTRSIRPCRGREAFAVKAGRFVAVGSTEEMKALDRQAHAHVRRQADDGGAGLHRHPQSRARRDPALRGAGRQPLRGRVRHHRQHRRQAARQGPRDAARHLGRGVFLRRHQGEGQARARRPRPRPGVDAITRSRCAIAAAIPRIYNSKAFAIAGVTKNTPELGRRHLRPRRQRRAQRPRHRPRARCVRQGRQAAELYARTDAAAQPRRARLHLQAVRPLRPDQRASRGRRPAGAAGGARARRSPPPRELRSRRTTCWRP